MSLKKRLKSSAKLFSQICVPTRVFVVGFFWERKSWRIGGQRGRIHFFAHCHGPPELLFTLGVMVSLIAMQARLQPCIELPCLFRQLVYVNILSFLCNCCTTTWLLFMWLLRWPNLSGMNCVSLCGLDDLFGTMVNCPTYPTKGKSTLQTFGCIIWLSHSFS